MCLNTSHLSNRNNRHTHTHTHTVGGFNGIKQIPIAGVGFISPFFSIWGWGLASNSVDKTLYITLWHLLQRGMSTIMHIEYLPD